MNPIIGARLRRILETAGKLPEHATNEQLDEALRIAREQGNFDAVTGGPKVFALKTVVNPKLQKPKSS